jgi:hypothetical protein
VKSVEIVVPRCDFQGLYRLYLRLHSVFVAGILIGKLG